jgi:hypothetical protein
LEMVNRFYAGNYYLFLSLCPDLESIRRGSVSIAECQGMDWTKKHAFNGLKNISSQLAAFFPYTGKIKHYHTSSIFNVMFTMLKKTFPAEDRARFFAGLTPDTPRLDTFFLVPNYEVAKERVITSMQDTLKLRFENEAIFSLEVAGHGGARNDE